MRRAIKIALGIACGGLVLAWAMGTYVAAEYSRPGLQLGIGAGTVHVGRMPIAAGTGGWSWSRVTAPSGGMFRPIWTAGFEEFIRAEDVAGSTVVFAQDGSAWGVDWLDERGRPLTLPNESRISVAMWREPRVFHSINYQWDRPVTFRYADGKTKTVDVDQGAEVRLITASNHVIEGTAYSPDGRDFTNHIRMHSRARISIKLWLPFAIVAPLTLLLWRRELVCLWNRRNGRYAPSGLRRFVKRVGIATCIFTAGAWIASHQWLFTYTWSDPSIPLAWAARSGFGGVYIDRCRETGSRPVGVDGPSRAECLPVGWFDDGGWGRRRWPEHFSPSVTLPPDAPRNYRLTTFGGCVGHWELDVPWYCVGPSLTYECQTIWVPFWPILVGIGIPTFVLAWRDRPYRRGLCRRCGYDLRGCVGHICPECGGDFTPRRRAVWTGYGRNIAKRIDECPAAGRQAVAGGRQADMHASVAPPLPHGRGSDLRGSDPHLRTQTQ